MARELSVTESESLFEDDINVLTTAANHDFSSTDMFGEHSISPAVASCQSHFLSSLDQDENGGTNLDVLQLLLDPVSETHADESMPLHQLSASASLVSSTHEPIPTFAHQEPAITSIPDNTSSQIPHPEPPNSAFIPRATEFNHITYEIPMENQSRQAATIRRQQLAARRMLKRAARHTTANPSDLTTNVTPSLSQASNDNHYSAIPENTFVPGSPTFITPDFNNFAQGGTGHKNILQLNGRVHKESRRPTCTQKKVSCIRAPCTSPPPTPPSILRLLSNLKALTFCSENTSFLCLYYRSVRKQYQSKSSTAHLTAEERRQRRAQRNRESAEKSRVRRKLATAELERSVGNLREESLHNEERCQNMVALLNQVLRSVRTTGDSEESRQMKRLLNESLELIARVKGQCPRTFRQSPHEIELKF